MSYYATADRAAPPMAGGAAGPYDRAPFHPHSSDAELARNVAAPMPQVVAELNQLHDLAEVADSNGKLLRELRERLTPVLRPLPIADDPRAAGNGACQFRQVEPLAPLASDIRTLGEQIGDRLRESNAMLRWLLDALGV